MSKLLVGLSALIGMSLIAFGFYAVYATTTVTAMTGLAPQGVAGMNEARSIYAGSFWAMGGLILYGLANVRIRQPLLLAVGVIFAGFVLGRIVSIAMDGYDPLLTAAIGSEVVAAIILLAASRTPVNT
ncbi:MAG: hypothetical protein B7Y89_02095 [Novosphingobium sp. 32-60-15]|uniref:DUF4345 family protein n=1 Tax=unclassified Novosphingobium TaxID=2644732 RepID=UPI000BDABE93|nr:MULTISPECIES: DUF4345 family protein [unclassified Novosphingobium]OYX64425.1 MAG: hypothetical protein B7Y89_02095 [Novosphingobium sp. 32-60-15]